MLSVDSCGVLLSGPPRQLTNSCILFPSSRVSHLNISHKWERTAMNVVKGVESRRCSKLQKPTGHVIQHARSLDHRVHFKVGIQLLDSTTFYAEQHLTPTFAAGMNQR